MALLCHTAFTIFNTYINKQAIQSQVIIIIITGCTTGVCTYYTVSGDISNHYQQVVGKRELANSGLKVITLAMSSHEY